MMMVTWGLLTIVAVVLIWSVLIYNRLVQSRNRIANATRMGALAVAENALGGSLGRLMALAGRVALQVRF